MPRRGRGTTSSANVIPTPSADSPDIEPVPASAPTRGRVLLLVKLVVSVGLLALLFRQTNVAAVAERVRGLSPVWLAVALGLLAVMVLVSAWRWRLLLRTQGVAGSWRLLTSSFLVATFFNNFLPSNIGGDVIRIADTAPLAGSRTLAAGVVLADRALGLVALVLVAAAGSWVAGGAPGESAVLWVALAGTMAAGLPTFFAPELIARAVTPLRWLGIRRANMAIDRLLGMVGRFRDQRAAVGGAFCGALVVQLVLVGFYAAVARALDIPLSLWAALLVVPVSLVFQMLPVSINGFGVREAVFTVYFARLGLPVDAALALSLVSTATLALFSTTGGITFLLRRRLHPQPA